ncbi:MAG: beta-ketoacyl-[acyl-carrier-protein] synthase family protein [Oligosphaeraceae bacterium]|nr:beta-ketoacyl-[acyl-carrier-protein] synthase family protein [Oligosphaeraceae bacterium]
MHRHNHVYVSGKGMISALGPDVPRAAAALYAPHPRLPALSRKVETALKLPVFEIPDLEPDPGVPGGFSLQLLRCALQEALSEAGLSARDLARQRVGVCIGTTVACQLNNIPFYATLRSGGTPPAQPFRDYIAGNPAEWTRREFHLQGPALTVSNACSSGADAIGIAMLWIRQGLCDLVICGGTDEINKVPLDGFNALGVCSPEPCRPFDARRNGLNLGEGAGILILSARAPVGSAPCFALAGYGNSSDAFHITQPDPEGKGLERAIRFSLHSAGGISTSDIAFINAHGTGTSVNDQVESVVFQRLFQDSARFISTKGLTGHTLGAAGAIECILSLLMLEREMVPASTRFESLSPEMPLAPLSRSTAIPAAEYALSTSLAFGGSNTALVLRRL